MKKWIVTGIAVSTALNLRAQAPEMFRYQGRLVDGTNLVNATLPMSFKLYDALSGGNKLYEDSAAVTVVDGLYSTMIGDDTVFGSLTNALTNATVCLELTVNGTALSPRERLVSVPYALNVPAPAPNGDPTAVSNEVINARWTKNFYVNGDITMSDKETGLMWLYDANPCGATNWDSAVSYCESLSYAGYSDWKLPRLGELGPQFFSREFFTNLQPGCYWSSSSPAFTSSEAYWSGAWYVNMNPGTMNSYDKASSYYVWPVRGGQ